MQVSSYGLEIDTEVPLRLPVVVKTKEIAAVDIKPLNQFSVDHPRTAWRYPSDLRSEDSPFIQILQFPDGDWIQIHYGDDTGFLIDRTGTRVWVKHPSTATVEDTATYVLGPVLGFVLRLRGVAALHASAVMIDNRCITLVGDAGAGKSTTAAAFAMSGHPILTEDIAAVDDQGDRFSIQPGYPRVNLWPSSVELLFGAPDALPRICPQHPTWDKRYLDLSQPPYRFQGEPLPLGAIYLLDGRSADVSAPLVTPLAIPEALLTLVANTYANVWLDKAMRAQEFEVLSRLVQQVPVRRVTPHADPARIWDLCHRIVDDFRSLYPVQSTLEDLPTPAPHG